MNRRDILSAAATLVMPGYSALAQGIGRVDPPVHDEEPKVVAEIASKLAQAGTKLGKGSKTGHYWIFDDMGRKHEEILGGFCENFLAEQLDAFGRAGLPMRYPSRRMMLVALERDVFVELAKIENVNVGAHGFYSPTNRACFFTRQYRMNLASMPLDWETTLIILSHEATHQICYNSGLLDPLGDVPACVTEGLAVVGELTSTKDVPKMLRQPNRLRLSGLVQAESRGLIPLDEFFRNDDHLWSKDAEIDHDHWTDAYSWAWMLVYTLLTQDDLRPKFKAYLNAIARRKDKKHRLADARAHLGNLSALQDRLIRRMHLLFANPPSKYKSFRRVGREP